MSHVLVIDDDMVFAQTLQRAFGRHGWAADLAHDRSQALRMATVGQYTHFVLDLNLGSDSGLLLVEPLRKLCPEGPLVVLTGYASIATTVQAMKWGATNVLPKPARMDEILAALGLGAEPVKPADSPVEPSDDLVPMSVQRMEWEHIARVLAEHDGNVSATARALNMHRRTLQRKLAKKPVKR